MKKFNISCDFEGRSFPVTFYIGSPEIGHHPIHFQAEWLGKQRGGNVPSEVMDIIAKLHEVAKRYSVPLEDLIAYVTA